MIFESEAAQPDVGGSRLGWDRLLCEGANTVTINCSSQWFGNV